MNDAADDLPSSYECSILFYGLLGSIQVDAVVGLAFNFAAPA
jgi:hypothetical protein